MSITVGKKLKKLREEKGFSRDDVSRSIHIRPYFIEALEEDRFDELHSPVQVRGFIRLYADWLGLDSNELLALLDNKMDDSLPLKPIEPEASIAKPENTILKVLSKGKKNKSVNESNPDLTLESDDTNGTIVVKEVENKGNEDTAVDLDVDNDLTDSNLSSQDIFNLIGNRLRTCRDKLDISVNEIEKLTHIRSRYLIDMESGNFNDIPSLVQARGLLAGYTSFLNLDNDEMLGLFADALQKRRVELLPVEPEKVQKDKKKKRNTGGYERKGIFRFITVDFLIGSVTIIGLVGFGIIAANTVISSNKEIKEAPPPIAEVLLQVPTSDSFSPVTPEADLTQVVRNPESIGLYPTEGPVTDFILSDGSPTPPVPDLGDASMQVYIVPNQRVFLQVTIGKKVAFLGRTVPGNAYPFTSDERIEVVCGNAAALQIYYNQRDLGTLGLSGQALRLIFSKDGISTPTPLQPSLPSSTPLPTLTLRPSATTIPPTVTPLIP